MDTLALGYTLPAIGRVTDLHRLENVRAGRTIKEQVFPNWKHLLWPTICPKAFKFF